MWKIISKKHNEVEQQLGNKRYYKMLYSDPTETHEKLVNLKKKKL